MALRERRRPGASSEPGKRKLSALIDYVLGRCSLLCRPLSLFRSLNTSYQPESQPSHIIYCLTIFRTCCRLECAVHTASATLICTFLSPINSTHPVTYPKSISSYYPHFLDFLILFLILFFFVSTSNNAN